MPAQNRVLLVGWEGADWGVIHSLLDAGKMPHLEAIISGGVAGELITLQPQAEPLLWNSLATGTRGNVHQVLGFLDTAAGELRPTSSLSRRAPTFWEIADRAGLRTHVLGWPDYPAESISGTFATQLFSRVDEGTGYCQLPRLISPAGKQELFAPLRIDPSEIGHEELLTFVPRAAEIDQKRDPALAIIATWLAEWTTNHMIATAVMEDDPEWDCALICYDALDRFGHAFMRFHPPRCKGISQSEFSLYQYVMTMAYCFADMQLGRLSELAGPETTVMVFSNHGFRCGGDRPTDGAHHRGNVAWHRPLGVLAMRGPSIRRDEWIWGGSILDICPTVLKLLGVEHDFVLAGHVLEQAFSESPFLSSKIPTSKKVTPSTTIENLSPKEDEAILRHFVSEGFLLSDQLTCDSAVAHADNARDFNLALVYLELGKHAEAADIFQKLVDRRPEIARFALQLANCQLAMGLNQECRESLAIACQRNLPKTLYHRALGNLLLAEKEYTAALEQLFLAEQLNPYQKGIHAQIGEVYLAMSKPDEATRAFGKELELDVDNPQAHAGLGELAFLQEDFETALEHYLDSVALQSFQPQAHCSIGAALLKVGRLEDAERALKLSLSQSPKQQETHYWLAELCDQLPGREQDAARHRQQAKDWYPSSLRNS